MNIAIDIILKSFLAVNSLYRAAAAASRLVALSFAMYNILKKAIVAALSWLPGNEASSL